MNKKVALVIGAALILLVAIGGPFLVATTDDTKGDQRTPPLDLASTAADRFFERYVNGDGRVVRHDQDGDTVSEGQAYAMLIAAATGERERFDSVWNWAKKNLMQPNGLLAWRWQDGKVADPQPASDADLDAARALAVASHRFDDKRYSEEARALAKAIADHQVAYPGGGPALLVAGPWATGTSPYYINPSYHSPRAEQQLAKLTDDKRWPEMLVRQRQIVDALIGTGDKVTLPSDWATVADDGSVVAAPAPGKKDAPRYSYDAVRLPIRLAESCDVADRQQAARLWNVLNRSRETRSAAALGLDGSVVDKTQTAVAAVGAAGGATAAGDTNQALALLDLAERIDTNRASYYGSAGTALGRIMLTTNWLGAC